jgi:DNA mismatch repair protein MutS
LFATHYFELSALAATHAGCHNVHFTAEEYGEHIIFHHTLQPGAASQSYGLQVAKLAGVPKRVIAKAKQSLQTPAAVHPVVAALAAADLSKMTPKEALDLLLALKAKLSVDIP